MKTTKIKKITTEKKQTFDITIKNNHNFFCNGHLIHNCSYNINDKDRGSNGFGSTGV